MSQAIQGDTSSNPPVLPVKRKRGRPRKDQTVNRLQITPVPPGFEGVKGNQPRRVDDVNDAMVGQALSGVVEAAFDAGYLLTVRIGNSNTNLRGVVFKPGHYLPVTAENDVAPHVQMIRRNEIHIHGNSRSRTSTMQNGSSLPNQLHGLAQQTTDKTTAKGKYAAPTTLSVPPVGARGNVVPVVLQPASMSNGIHQAPQDGSPELDDDEVHTVEPLAMLPPDALAPTRQVPMAQNQSLPSQLYAGQHVAQGSSQNGDSSSSGTSKSGQEEEGKPVKVTEIHTPDAPTKGHQVSSPSSQVHNDEAYKSVSKESSVLQEQHFQAVHSSLQQPIPVTQPLKSYPAGRMTELLLALQENMPDHQTPHAKHPSSGFRADNAEDSRD